MSSNHHPHHLLLDQVQHFYESCKSLDYIASDREKPLMKIINNLGGWDVLRFCQLWDSFEMIWDDLDTTLVQLWDSFEIIWDNMDTTLVQLWDSFGIIWDSMDTTLGPLGVLGSTSGHFFLALLLCSLLQPCSRSFNLYNWDPHRVLRELHSEFGVSAFFEVTSSSSSSSSSSASSSTFSSM